MPQGSHFRGSAISEKLSGLFWVLGVEAIPEVSEFSEVGSSPNDSVHYNSSSDSSLEITQS